MVTPYVLLKTLIDPVVFLLVLIATGFWISFKRRKKSSGYIVLLITFVFLYSASISPLSNTLCYFLEKDYLLKDSGNLEKLDIVVVLGGGASDNRYIRETMPSFQTTSRLHHAIQVFRRTGAKYLVCAGKGVGRLSEAGVMKNSAEGLGIPVTSIKIDPDSRDTWEHAENLNKMFPNKDIKIGLVTSAYHMKRSEREFRKYFPNVIPLPSDYLYSSSPLSIMTFIPSSGSLYKFSTAFREMIGIGWYRIKG